MREEHEHANAEQGDRGDGGRPCVADGKQSDGDGSAEKQECPDRGRDQQQIPREVPVFPECAYRLSGIRQKIETNAVAAIR